MNMVPLLTYLVYQDQPVEDQELIEQRLIGCVEAPDESMACEVCHHKWPRRGGLSVVLAKSRYDVYNGYAAEVKTILDERRGM